MRYRFSHSLVWTFVILCLAAQALASADRKDGLTTIHADPLPPDPRADLISELRAARQAGDVDRTQTLHARLGWIAGPSKDAGGLCERVVLTGARTSPPRWEADVLVDNPARTTGHPTMFGEPNGRLWIADEDMNANYIHVYFSDNGGITWNYDFSLSATGADITNPSIAVGEGGSAKRLLIVYEYAAETVDSAILAYAEDLYTHDYVYRTIEQGYLLRYPRICVDSPEEDYWYPYVTYVRGTIAERTEYSTVLFTRSYDYGSSWNTPYELAVQATRDNRPDIDFGEEDLFVVYTRTYGPGDRDTYVRRSSDYGSQWDPEIALGYSSEDECYPRVAATNGGGAVVAAFSQWHSGSSADIVTYYSANSGDTWNYAAFPTVPGGGVSGGTDLCASLEYGSIHAAFVRGAHVYYTGTDHAAPYNWSELEIVDDTQTAEGDEWVAVAVDARREVDECVAWADHRTSGQQQVYFDSGYPQGEYIIIDGANDLADELAPLIEWKESLGYLVRYITRNQIFNAYPTGDNAERIWYYLRDRYVEARYVLLVGTLAQIPMRILYPDGDPGNAGGYGSDYYYARLNTTDWDLDDDDRWGEFYEDALNFYPDAIVGRIPFGDGPRVATVAQNIVDFEQDTGAWKKRILMAHGIMNNTEEDDPKTDMAHVGAKVQLDFLAPQGWAWDTLYEHGGQNASIYTSTGDLSQTNYELYSGLQMQGVISCLSHGGTTGMTSYQWSGDVNGNGYVDVDVEYDETNFATRSQVPVDPVSALVFLAGCNTGVLFGTDTLFATSQMRSRYLYTIQHDATTLLALLENGAPAVIGSSAGTDYEFAWEQINQGDIQSLCYFFYYFLIVEGMRAGDAFNAAQIFFYLDQDPQRGIRDINYFGDPALEIAGVDARRWRSSDFASRILPRERALFAKGSPPVRTAATRDENPTIWWPSGKIEASRSVDAIICAADQSLYAGVNTYPEGSSWKGTVERSMDGGDTWIATGGLADCRSVTSILEAGTGTLIAAGLAHFGDNWHGAIYRSTNGGETWSRVYSFPGGMVLDLMEDGFGNLWAASGWNGTFYASIDDGITWFPHMSLGPDIYIHSLMQTSQGRLFVTLGGPGAAAKVMWSDDGVTWIPGVGIFTPRHAYDLIESGGLLYAGAASPSGGEVYVADIQGEVWYPLTALADENIRAVRCLCAAPAGLILAGCETRRGTSYTDVLAWDQESGQWYSFGGMIDAARQVRALCALPEMVYAGTANRYGRIYKHLLPTFSSAEESAASTGVKFAWTNPAQSSVELRYDLPQMAPVRIGIYDATGRLLRNIAREPAVGAHVWRWDGRTQTGQPVPAGVYTAQLSAGRNRATGRIVLLR